MNLNHIIRYLSAADEREELSELAQKAEDREGRHKREKPADAQRRSELQTTIMRRFAYEIAALLALGAATWAGITHLNAPVKSGGAADVIPKQTTNTGGEKALQTFNLEDPGLAKRVHWFEDKISPEAEDALERALEKAHFLALQDPERRERFKKATIEIIFAPDLAAAVEIVSTRNGLPQEKRLSLVGWEGDALTLSLIDRPTGRLRHTFIFHKKLAADGLGLGVALDHELGHVERAEAGTMKPDRRTEEHEAFLASVDRMERLLRQLEQAHGPTHPDVVRLRDTLLPREREMLRSWDTRRK
jgi:hypothetical protein